MDTIILKRSNECYNHLFNYIYISYIDKNICKYLIQYCKVYLKITMNLSEKSTTCHETSCIVHILVKTFAKI